MAVVLRTLGMAMLVALPMGGCIHGGTHGIAPVSESIGRVDAPSEVGGSYYTSGEFVEFDREVFGAKRPGRKLEVPPAPIDNEGGEWANVIPAMAWEEPPERTSIIPTSGIFDQPAESIKQGVARVADAVTPTPRVIPAEDPTLLSTKAKPTPELHLSMAKYYEDSGQPALAEQSYQHALRMAPKHLAAHLAYARFKERQGQISEAIQWCQKAARMYSNEAAIFNDLGLICARHGIHAEALAAYRRAIEIQPKRALYRNNIAVLLVDMGQPEEAMKHLTAVYSPAEASYNLGYLLQAKGDVNQAIEAFSRARALNPSMTEALVWLQRLESEQAAAARVGRRPSNAGGATPSFQAYPGPTRGSEQGADQETEQLGTPARQSQEPAERFAPSRSGGVKSLPPPVQPLPDPPVRRLPNPGPSSSPPDGPVPWPRRLPPVSAERPIAYEESLDDLAVDARRVILAAEGVRDAPLPPSHPSGPAAP